MIDKIPYLITPEAQLFPKTRSCCFLHVGFCDLYATGQRIQKHGCLSDSEFRASPVLRVAQVTCKVAYQSHGFGEIIDLTKVTRHAGPGPAIKQAPRSGTIKEAFGLG